MLVQLSQLAIAVEFLVMGKLQDRAGSPGDDPKLRRDRPAGHAGRVASLSQPAFARLRISVRLEFRKRLGLLPAGGVNGLDNPRSPARCPPAERSLKSRPSRSSRAPLRRMVSRSAPSRLRQIRRRKPPGPERAPTTGRNAGTAATPGLAGRARPRNGSAAHGAGRMASESKRTRASAAKISAAARPIAKAPSAIVRRGQISAGRRSCRSW